MNKGKTIFAQIMSLINEYEFKKCIDCYRGDRHAIKFSCRDQFLIMSFAQFTDRSELRDIETTLDLCAQDLYRSGPKAMPRSTLAEANEKKNWRIPFDSTTIDLCLALCPWATFHHRKGAIKVHTLMDLRGSIPTFVRSFDSLYKHFHLNHVFFVTRAKDNMRYEALDFREVDPQAGILSDETIRPTGYYSVQKYPDALKLVVYEDFREGTAYRFLTNNFTLEAISIAEFYRDRWQIEIFFKWIKQHLHIKTFYGTSRSAVYTQIWIAICDYLLLIIAKKHYGLEPSLHTISNSIGQILFKRGDIREMYNQPSFPVIVPEAAYGRQLTLW